MTVRDTPQSENPLRRQLTELYDVLSNKIAGGQRIDHRNMLPGADDPSEGLIPDEFADQLTTLDWFTPSQWAGLSSEDALRADMSLIPEPGGAGVLGTGGDFFRTGQAPDNFTNRNNPLYLARRDFATQITPQLNELFGVTGHAGAYRTPSESDADPGGRAVNSDHLSAGAVDFYGTVEQLDALRDYLVEQPWVSFVRWRSESHGGESGEESGAHVHVSFDLGWVARNYFNDRTTPTVRRPTPSTPRSPGAAGTPTPLNAPGAPAAREGAV